MDYQHPIDLILIAPFVIVCFLTFRRYGKRMELIRWKPFFIRVMTWHLVASVVANLIYPIAAGLVADESISRIAKGCGQGMRTLESELLRSCPSHFGHAFVQWIAMTCVVLGAIGLLIVFKKIKRK